MPEICKIRTSQSDMVRQDQKLLTHFLIWSWCLMLRFPASWARLLSKSPWISLACLSFLAFCALIVGAITSPNASKPEEIINHKNCNIYKSIILNTHLPDIFFFCCLVFLTWQTAKTVTFYLDGKQLMHIHLTSSIQSA